MMPADHVATAAISAVGDYEYNVIDPGRRGYYSDAFGFIQVHPHRGVYRVTDASGAYMSAIGMVVS
jgi:hypothetical protein